MAEREIRHFPVFDRVGGLDHVIDAMVERGFSKSPKRLIERWLERRAISRDGAMFLMRLAAERGIALKDSDFTFCRKKIGHDQRRIDVYAA